MMKYFFKFPMAININGFDFKQVYNIYIII